MVSTRSRPKAAGITINRWCRNLKVSTRSRPKAAGFLHTNLITLDKVSTRSRPKAAGTKRNRVSYISFVSTRSRPKAAGCLPDIHWLPMMFQHAAARRRLDERMETRHKPLLFQHAAARRRLDWIHTRKIKGNCFNTQPPEGGWQDVWAYAHEHQVFQHAAARRRLGPPEPLVPS